MNMIIAAMLLGLGLPMGVRADGKVKYYCGWGCNDGVIIISNQELPDGVGKYGFIDKNGKMVVPLKYDHIDGFKDGFCPVSNNGKCGIIDKKGR